MANPPIKQTYNSPGFGLGVPGNCGNGVFFTLGLEAGTGTGAGTGGLADGIG